MWQFVGKTAMIFCGDCLDMLPQIPDESVQLVVTSPPYNIGKVYEGRRISVEAYVDFHSRVVKECARVIRAGGSICWETGNYVDGGEILPLDILFYDIFKANGLRLRNRIVWTYGHGLHSSRRFSGRYETIMWFTKGDNYNFNLDAVRVPQKYPGKRHFKGPKTGQLSCNLNGKNPSDVWDIPNVKHNHVEKTDHPCQFPIALVRRLVLALSNEKDIVLDPFMGSGTTLVAAIMQRRKAFGSDNVRKYCSIAQDRIKALEHGNLKYRSDDPPIDYSNTP